MLTSSEAFAAAARVLVAEDTLRARGLKSQPGETRVRADLMPR